MVKTFFVAFIFLWPGSLSAGIITHDLKVRIEPARNSLAAEDTITLPRSGNGEAGIIFSLHKGLAPSILTKGATLRELDPDGSSAVYGLNYSTGTVVAAKYSLLLPPGVNSFTIKYSGVINHPQAEQAENYARSFSETPGLITADGVYLAGASFWYPQFDGRLSAFKLETDLPYGYESVAGGGRLSRAVRGDRTLTVWKTASPQDEITLVCGRYKEYDAGEADLKLQVFLRTPDDELARKYLDAAGRYVEMYSGLLGPYPYGKFALVENFWETGYGVPSFTLLGSRVIRLPFILNSSYPHEILHNWWGNGVFVDYEKGNWCEGLTAYLADYLISEGRGKGREYRMTVLQKYADYVRSGKDLPLRDFRSRNSSASEAVGYGKALMFYHMLRAGLGDEKFKAGLRDFYKKNKFKYASFEDLKRSFEGQTGGTGLDEFFAQWVDRSGAPELALKDVRVTPGTDGFELEFSIAQLQDGPAYKLEVPVAVQLENISRPRLLRLAMKKKEEHFKYSSTMRPARVEIDPEFDLFRKLSPLETPPTLSRLLGAEKPLIILPSAASGAAGAAYEAFALAWTRDKNNLPEIKRDSELAGLPAGRRTWVIGAENKFYPALAARLEPRGVRFSRGRTMIGNRDFPSSSCTFVFADLNPENPLYSTGLILAARPEKLQLLASRLPHYGKYGYLVFDEEMTSLAAGGWETGNSPLAAVLDPGAPRPAYPAREPLAAPASAFSADRMKQHVLYLASGPEGRGPGEPGLEKARKYISAMFRRYGLMPLSESGFAQEWTDSGRTLTNLAGMVQGSGRKHEYLVISAHYDHLPPEHGRSYPGANDNASGVALMLELADYYSKHAPGRSIIFAAFDGEEEGRLGSERFVKSRLAPLKTDADINLDSVGRLDGGNMMFLNSGSSDKWVHILRGAGFVTGYDYEASKQDLDSSDQASFIKAGVPAVQLFSGVNADYHKATDTADKIDYGGMVKEAEFIREIADYLAGDSDFITRPRSSLNPLPPAPGLSPRKASTGLTPSFDWQGTGVKADSVADGSPLWRTGFKAGDVIVKINDIPTEDLRAYARELKKYAPGDRIKITYLSDSLEKTAEIDLSAVIR
ncbi:MAG: M28 family peptidase [Elusimicrobiales bacterium]|jgi:hypothetical protein